MKVPVGGEGREVAVSMMALNIYTGQEDNVNPFLCDTKHDELTVNTYASAFYSMHLNS